MTSPAFQFYVQDFLTGTMLLTAEEVGAYLLLLCYQWDKGALPDNDRDLQRIARTRSKVLEKVKEKFEVGEDGLLRNVRLEREREKQVQWKQKSAEAGRKSGETRRTKMNQPSLLVHQNSEPNTNTSASASSSTSNKAHTPLAFLKFRNEVALTDLQKNSTLPDPEWEECCAKWENAVLGDTKWDWTDDDDKNYRILYNRLSSYAKSWAKFSRANQKKNFINKDKPPKNRQHDYSQYKRI